MKKQNKLGFLALIGLAAVASIFTVCKATGANDVFQSTTQVKLWNVTFDADGGEPVPEAVAVADGETIGKMPESPKKAPSDFGGWYLDLEGDQFDPETPVTRDITLLAKWLDPPAPGHVRVTFNGAGGSPGITNVDVLEGGTVNPLPTVERTGCNFGGWYPAGSETEFTASTPVSGAITVFAKWTVVTYSVSYNANGGTGSMASSTHTYGESKRLSAISTGTISNEGHTFSGWALSEDNPSWDYGDNDEVSNLAATQDAVVPLYAVWAASAPAPSPIPATMVSVAGGAFTMGSPGTEADRQSNEVEHQVTVSSFYMGKHEVTQKEYWDTMGSWPETAPSDTKGLGDDYPMYYVSWLDAVAYCNKRSEDEGLTPAYTVSGETVTWDKSASGYRLPTEAEWEYACRAGTTSPFSTGGNITTDQVNYNGNYPYNGNPAGEYRGKTTEAGFFAPNAYGLYDMHGNVWEWCWDRYGDYASGPLTNPDGAVSGASRVLRGGSWFDLARYLRSALRNYNTPSYRYFLIGFRLVRPLE